jgi:uncharacterized protein (DUF1015 family)
MELRAFRGWRFAAPGNEVSKLIAPPYDILSAADKQELLAASERNIVAVDLPHVPPKEVGPESAYLAAADLLTNWQTTGVLARDVRPAMYAYRQTFDWEGRSYARKAILAQVRLSPLGKDVIPHEHTFAGPKADRLKLMQFTRVQLSPIFGFYTGPQAEQALWSSVGGRSPDAHGVLRGVREELWTIDDANVTTAVAGALRNTPVYIADGHHRYTTAINYRDSLAGGKPLRPDHAANFVMFALVEKSDPGLLILPTHRIFRGVGADFSMDKLQGACPAFEWRRSPMPAADQLARALSAAGAGAMGFVPAGAAELWIARLKDPRAMAAAKPDELPAWRKLDVAVLHTLVVDGPLAKWRTPAATTDYTPDASAVIEACRTGQAQLGACLQGTPLAAVEEVASVGGYMPHKSTYFYPKLATGMVLAPLED